MPDKLDLGKFASFKHEWEQWKINFRHLLMKITPPYNGDKFYNYYVYSCWEDGMALEKLLDRFYANPNYRLYTVGLDICIRKSLMEMKGFPKDIVRTVNSQDHSLALTDVINDKRETQAIEVLWMMATRVVRKPPLHA